MPSRLIHAVGKLVIEYQAFGKLHTLSVGLLMGQDPGNPITMGGEGNALAFALRAVMPADVTLTNWHTLDTRGVRLLSGAIFPTAVGQHAVNGQAFRSNTLTFSGRGTTNTPQIRNGVTRMMLHVYAAFPPTATEQRLPLSADLLLGDVATFLRNSVVSWSDFNGSKATVNGYVTQQFNSRTQKHEGA